MKIKIYLLILASLMLTIFGVWYLIIAENALSIVTGLLTVIINPILIMINLRTLKKLKKK
jgi:hypothetical protein